MFSFIPVLLAVLFARPARDGGWYARIAVLDGVLTVVAVSAPVAPLDPAAVLIAVWMIAEAGWVCWRSVHAHRGPIRRGGGARMVLALLLAGIVARTVAPSHGAVGPIDGPAAILLVGLFTAMTATTPEGRIGSLLVADGGLLLACRDVSAAGFSGLVPVLLARGILLGMLEWGRLRGPDRERTR